MKGKRDKRLNEAYDDYWESPYLMIGCYGGFQPKPEGDKKIKPQIGFIRQEVKRQRKRK